MRFVDEWPSFLLRHRNVVRRLIWVTPVEIIENLLCIVHVSVHIIKMERFT